MGDDDTVAKALYIGSLILTAATSLVVLCYLRAHPALHRLDRRSVLVGMSVDVSRVLLFGVALCAALLLPAVGYDALPVMALAGPLQHALAKMLRGDSGGK